MKNPLIKNRIIIICMLNIFGYFNISGQTSKNIYPQKEIDKLYQKSLHLIKCNEKNKNIQLIGKNISEKTGTTDVEFWETKVLHGNEFLDNNFLSEKPVLGIKNTLYIGPGNDTTIIDSTYTQYGDIIVFGNGVLIVDSAQLTLYGHLIGYNKGQIILRNHAYLYVPQQYVSQYPQAFYDSSKFEATNSKIYANTCYRTFLHDYSEYICKHVDFPYWNFRQLYNRSKLYIEDARMVGDLTINDSCEVTFIDCDTILPWFGFEAGDTLNIQFPSINNVNHYKFDSATTGVKGINYSVTFDTCRMVVWGIESFPQSSVHINNSVFSGTFRIKGNDTLNFNNLRDHLFYTNLNVPFNDRNFSATNSYSQIWCIYTYDDIVLYMDSCEWGESHAKENSKIFASNSISLGFPSCATSTESGYYYFTEGKCRAFISAWNNSINIVENALVIPDRPGGSAQAQNFAHDNSYILAINSYFENNPEALDTSLVMFVYIDSLNTINTDTISNMPVYGSVWLDAGAYNTTTFNQYKLYYQSVDSSSWIFINSSTNPVDSNILGTWNVSGLQAGDYIIKLTISNSNNDSLSALRKVTLTNNTSINEQIFNDPSNFVIYPNPVSNTALLFYNLPADIDKAYLLLYNSNGEEIRSFVLDKKSVIKEISFSELHHGIYFYNIHTKYGISETKKIIY